MLYWVVFVLLPFVLCTNEICPGGSKSCPDSATCCQLSDMSYGCCPLQNAVCCDDHIHCCPERTKCEVGLCVQPDGANVTAKRLPIEYITCFGTNFTCPDRTTCCKGMAPHTYGCCPLERAVCCSDGSHCCPEGTVCNVQEEKCVGKGFVSEMYDSQKNRIPSFNFPKYLPLVKPNMKSIICPGSSFQCPDGYTCCQLPSLDWGCCPFTNATCCKDHLHCCPEHMQCDLTSKNCFQGDISIPSLEKELSKPFNADITCPDNSTCDDSMTCCKVNEQQFGCCPYPNAVCCQDEVHCCPNDYLCDVVEQHCIPKKKWLSNVVKMWG